MSEPFNLDAPPGFRGLDPDKPLRKYIRHLPHWRQDGATYAVTFRLSDSLPKAKLEMLASMRREWEAKFPEPRSEKAWQRYARTVTSRVNEWLDQGSGECHFSNWHFANELARAILHFQNEQYHVASYVVMPNHCHLIVRPFSAFELEDLLGAIKGVTSRFVNRELGRIGELWQQESFDRIIRDEEHLYNAIQYIGNNPLNVGLPESQWFRWVDPEWESLQWGFREA
ncbi:transposase [Rhodopirellula europaea]|uniref:transposase n=1 Tax=Rhodopirellula europaea TaxID=1263866 RepID=UPI003D2AF162